MPPGYYQLWVSGVEGGGSEREPLLRFLLREDEDRDATVLTLGSD